LRSLKLVVLEQARKVRSRAALCLEIAALTANQRAVALLEELSHELEAEAAELERLVRGLSDLAEVGIVAKPVSEDAGRA
jgi:hypothetical protein